MRSNQHVDGKRSSSLLDAVESSATRKNDRRHAKLPKDIKPCGDVRSATDEDGTLIV
jgi:hypothetical protein